MGTTWRGTRAPVFAPGFPEFTCARELLYYIDGRHQRPPGAMRTLWTVRASTRPLRSI